MQTSNDFDESLRSQMTSFDEEIHSTKPKPLKEQIHDSNTSDDEAMDQERTMNRVKTSKRFKTSDKQDSLLDLGNNEMTLKASTIPKHHQRRQNNDGDNTISTRPFAHHSTTSSSLPHLSLPEESQTTEELLHKI